MENIVAADVSAMNVLITKRNAGGAQRYRENHSGWNTQGRSGAVYTSAAWRKRNCPTAADAVNSRAAGMTSRTLPGRRRKTRQA